MRSICLALCVLLPSVVLAHHHDGMDWHYNGDDGWNLAFYGVPESHNVALIIRCERPGSLLLNMAFAHPEIGKRRHGERITVPLLLDLPDGERRTITVTGKVEKDEEDGDTVLATVSPKHPLIEALRDGKGSALGTRANWMPLKGAAEAVSNLLERCTQGR